jgi:glycosyltransferase involved in cell wall biosynthesis
MKISVVFPALNESAVIERTLNNALTHLHKLGEPFEVIVVDNASSDNTVALVEEISRNHPEVRVIRHPTNLGYGNSNLTGFRNAGGDVVAVADSDGQHTLADLPLFLEKLKSGAQVVYGWRRERHDPMFRKVVSAGLNFSSRRLLGWRLHDINCGFRVVTAPVAQSMKSVHPVNYFGPELWVHSVRNKFRVDEVVVQHSERAGGTSIHIPWRLPIIISRAFRYLYVLKGELNS